MVVLPLLGLPAMATRIASGRGFKTLLDFQTRGHAPTDDDAAAPDRDHEGAVTGILDDFELGAGQQAAGNLALN